MKEVVYNKDNLLEKEINKHVTRIKALIIKDENIYIGNDNNILQFIGGHLETGESFVNCLKREVLEEMGIYLEDDEISDPFMKIITYSKDWPSKGINQKSIIVYFIVKTDKEPDLLNVCYTKDEFDNNFKVEKVSLDNVVDLIYKNIPNNIKNEKIAPNMIEVLNEYLKNKN